MRNKFTRGDMSEELAARILDLRVYRGYSWRKIAEEVTGFSNQELGRDLCFDAEEILGFYFDEAGEDGDAAL